MISCACILEGLFIYIYMFSIMIGAPYEASSKLDELLSPETNSSQTSDNQWSEDDLPFWVDFTGCSFPYFQKLSLLLVLDGSVRNSTGNQVSPNQVINPGSLGVNKRYVRSMGR